MDLQTPQSKQPPAVLEGQSAQQTSTPSADKPMPAYFLFPFIIFGIGFYFLSPLSLQVIETWLRRAPQILVNNPAALSQPSIRYSNSKPPRTRRTQLHAASQHFRQTYAEAVAAYLAEAELSSNDFLQAAASNDRLNFVAQQAEPLRTALKNFNEAIDTLEEVQRRGWPLRAPPALPLERHFSPQLREHHKRVSQYELPAETKGFVKSVALARAIQDQDVRDLITLCEAQAACIEKASLLWLAHHHNLRERYFTQLAATRVNVNYLRVYQRYLQAQRAAVVLIDVGGEIAPQKELNREERAKTTLLNYALLTLLRNAMGGHYLQIAWLFTGSHFAENWQAIVRKFSAIDFLLLTSSGEVDQVVAPLDRLNPKDGQINSVFSTAGDLAAEILAELKARQSVVLRSDSSSASSSAFFGLAFAKALAIGFDAEQAHSRTWQAGIQAAYAGPFLAVRSPASDAGGDLVSQWLVEISADVQSRD